MNPAALACKVREPCETRCTNTNIPPKKVPWGARLDSNSSCDALSWGPNRLQTLQKLWFFVHFRFIAYLEAMFLHLPRTFSYVGQSWAVLGPSWGCLGPSWGHLGAILGRLGAIVGHLGAILGSCVRPQGPVQKRGRPVHRPVGVFNSQCL